jgi:hypothetical protein
MSHVNIWALACGLLENTEKNGKEPKGKGPSGGAAGYLVSFASFTRLDRMRTFIICGGLHSKPCLLANPSTAIFL